MKNASLYEAWTPREPRKKEIYGAGLLLSDQAAARKHNAEKQAAENARKQAEDAICYELSERERELVEALNKSILD